MFCTYIKTRIFNYLSLESNFSNKISPVIKQHPCMTQGLALSVTALPQCRLGIKEDLSVPQNRPGFFFSVMQKELISQEVKTELPRCFFLEMLRTWVQDGCRRSRPLHFQYHQDDFGLQALQVENALTIHINYKQEASQET